MFDIVAPFPLLSQPRLEGGERLVQKEGACWALSVLIWPRSAAGGCVVSEVRHFRTLDHPIHVSVHSRTYGGHDDTLDDRASPSVRS